MLATLAPHLFVSAASHLSHAGLQPGPPPAHFLFLALLSLRLSLGSCLHACHTAPRNPSYNCIVTEHTLNYVCRHTEPHCVCPEGHKHWAGGLPHQHQLCVSALTGTYTLRRVGCPAESPAPSVYEPAAPLSSPSAVAAPRQGSEHCPAAALLCALPEPGHADLGGHLFGPLWCVDGGQRQ